MGDHVPVSDTLLMTFAVSIHTKVTALQTVELSDAQRARLAESVSDDIRKCTDLVEPMVSRGALEKAAELGVDLYSQGWHDQPTFDKGRHVFQFEHVCPVYEVRAYCIAARSVEEVVDVLRTQLRVAWVLKSEDRILSQLGYRSHRPDPDAAYREAGIELIHRA